MFRDHSWWDLGTTWNAESQSQGGHMQVKCIVPLYYVPRTISSAIQVFKENIIYQQTQF